MTRLRLCSIAFLVSSKRALSRLKLDSICLSSSSSESMIASYVWLILSRDLWFGGEGGLAKTSDPLRGESDMFSGSVKNRSIYLG